VNNLEVPKDYILEIIKQSIYDKIDATENNLKIEIRVIKDDIHELKKEIQKFNVQCKHDMSNFDKRIKDNENFKIKIIAISGAVGVIAAFIFSHI